MKVSEAESGALSLCLNRNSSACEALLNKWHTTGQTRGAVEAQVRRTQTVAVAEHLWLVRPTSSPLAKRPTLQSTSIHSSRQIIEASRHLGFTLVEARHPAHPCIYRAR
jgi:hypothetical protein